MKKFIIFGSIFLCFLFLLFNEMYTNTSGSPAGRSGGAGELTCATSTCHTGNANTGPGTVSITSNALNDEYMPGQTYTITVTVDQSGISKFGFLTLVGYSASANASTGTIQLTNTTETRLRTSGARDYVTHRSAGTSGTNAKSWSFDWVAPGSNTGDVTFFASGNATNGQGNRTGDQVYTTSLVLTEMLTSLDPSFNEAPKVQVFPTFANESVTVRLDNAAYGEMDLQVVNLEGKVVYESREMAKGGQFDKTLFVNSWESGLYYLRVTGEYFASVHKIMKY